MKLATWNVNSLNVRLAHVLDFLAAQKPDVLCLQETKLEDAKFPIAEITGAGYQAVFSGQKTYNGVAILSPHSPQDVTMGIAEFEDPQKRVISAVVNGIRIVCVYIPNGESSNQLNMLQARLAAAFECLDDRRDGPLSASCSTGRLQHRAGRLRRA